MTLPQFWKKKIERITKDHRNRKKKRIGHVTKIEGHRKCQ
jgi:hypothetical protein